MRGATNDWGQLYLIQNKGHSLTTGQQYIPDIHISFLVSSNIFIGAISHCNNCL